MIYHIGNLRIEIEQDGPGPDAKVTYEGFAGPENLCWISYPDREEFVKEINDVINKYRI